MNLETRLEPRLWDAVRDSWEARKFSGAILDAVHFISDLIRERSGLEGDGVALVGQAFGGATPKLKVNRLQTESEQNVQRGIEALFRGMYQAIRNPRSHGTSTDDERDAVAILLFLDYLLRIVDQSKSPFSLPEFVRRILDPSFVPSDRYATLLVEEIPAGKRLAVCREVFAGRAGSDHAQLKYFFKALFDLLTDEEKKEFAELISSELSQGDEDGTVIFVIATMPSSLWPLLSEVARLRTEYRLAKSIEQGSRQSNGRLSSGALGSWASRLMPDRIISVVPVWRAIVGRLGSDDQNARRYALEYFAKHANDCFEKPPTGLIAAVLKGLKAGDAEFRKLAIGYSINPETGSEHHPDHPWRKPFLSALESFVEKQPSAEDDDIPF